MVNHLEGAPLLAQPPDLPTQLVGAIGVEEEEIDDRDAGIRPPPAGLGLVFWWLDVLGWHVREAALHEGLDSPRLAHELHARACGKEMEGETVRVWADADFFVPL